MQVRLVVSYDVRTFLAVEEGEGCLPAVLRIRRRQALGFLHRTRNR